MYEVTFDEIPIKELNKLPEDIRKRIFNKIIATKENPHHFFIRLKSRNDYKLRVGDYRIIADLNDKDYKIEVTFVGHRKNVYDKI